MKELAKYLEIETKELELQKYEYYGLEVYKINNEEYAVGTDIDCDIAWEEALDQYIDDCILPELPDFAARYFDNDSWKSDAQFDGRGHSLATYDGNEIELNNNFFAYRIN